MHFIQFIEVYEFVYYVCIFFIEQNKHSWKFLTVILM